MVSKAPQDDPQLITVQQAAKRLSCSRSIVYEHIKAGDLQVVPVGRRKGFRLDTRDLDAFIQNRKFRIEPQVRPKTFVRLKHLRT